MSLPIRNSLCASKERAPRGALRSSHNINTPGTARGFVRDFNVIRLLRARGAVGQSPTLKNTKKKVRGAEMEKENTEVEVVEVEETAETPVQMVLDSGQYEALVGVVEQTRQELQKSNEQLHSVWLLLAIMVLFETNRIINGIGQALRKVRKQ